MIKLLVSDLDGTLLSAQKDVSEHNRSALRKAAEAGISFCFASGRNHPEIVMIRDSIAQPVHAISQNGAFVNTSDGIALRSANFESDLFKRLAKLALTYDSLIILCGFDRSMTPVWHDRAEGISKRMLSPLDFRPDALEQIGGDSGFSKISCFGDMTELLKLQSAVAETFGPQVDTFVSDHDCLDLMPSGISKGSGLRMLLDHLGLRPEEAACIGDSFNDISMFELCPNSFAMSHSHPDVQQAARHRAESVADAIDFMLRAGSTGGARG